MDRQLDQRYKTRRENRSSSRHCDDVSSSLVGVPASNREDEGSILPNERAQQCSCQNLGYWDHDSDCSMEHKPRSTRDTRGKCGLNQQCPWAQTKCIIAMASRQLSRSNIPAYLKMPQNAPPYTNSVQRDRDMHRILACMVKQANLVHRCR